MSDSAGPPPHSTDEREWTDADARRSIRIPGPGDDKYTRGVLGVMTGSAMFPGAAVLGVEAASRAGVGMVRYLGPDRAADFVLQRRPEIVPTDGRVQAWLVGSGMDTESRSAAATAELKRVLGQGVPVVLDAGALDLVQHLSGPAVLTPHYRELAKLLSSMSISVSATEIATDPSGWAKRAATELSVTVLLKGNTTWVAGPEGTLFRVMSGPAWLATAGSGDVLGGVLGAIVASNSDLLAQRPAALAELAASAAHVHGRAGERASDGGPLVALDIAEALSPVIRSLLAG